MIRSRMHGRNEQGRVEKGRERKMGARKHLCLGPAHHHAQLRIVNEGGWGLGSIEYCEHYIPATYLLQ